MPVYLFAYMRSKSTFAESEKNLSLFRFQDYQCMAIISDTYVVIGLKD